VKRAQLAGAVGALLAVSALVISSSTAAFTAQTDNSGNSWEAGTVLLSDNDSGVAMFNATALAPGDGAQRCIVVTYDGNLAADVKLFGVLEPGGTGLENYLDLTVQRGSGTSADCTGFTSTETVYGGTLGGFLADHTAFSDGAGTWAPTGAGQSSTYRFAWSLQDNNDAQGKNVEASFVWEAQNQ
jgi:hypothetical protein